jgi:sulfide:quinone oxidoreductase
MAEAAGPGTRRRRARLVVAGAGIAGLEALVVLHTLAPGRVEARIVDPAGSFHLRPLDVGEPFGLYTARRYPLAEIASDLGAGLVSDRLQRVDHDRHAAILQSGRRVDYDILLVAVGSRPYPALPEGVLFDPAHGPDTLRDLAANPAGHTAIVVPTGVGWTLPAYELALILATHEGARVTLVTAERAPLEAFGDAGARLAREELAASGVALVSGVIRAVAMSPTRIVLPGGPVLEVDRIVHLPRHVGPGIPGLPCDAAGFVLAAADGAIPGVDDAFAAGDGTAGTVKHGGLAAQQGEAAARAIAARLGVESPRDATASRELRGILWTSRGPRYLRAHGSGGRAAAEVSRDPLWWPPTKVATSWLTPWLTTRDAHRAIPGSASTGRR